MSENEQVEVRTSARSAHTGKAPLIRKMKLKYPELNSREIARRVGCSAQNVDQVLARFLDGHSQDEIREFSEKKAEIYDALQMRLLESITKENIEKTRVYPRVVAAGILEDKARTIRGQATGINVSVLVDLVEAIKANRK
jgi:hypothetical protein